MAISLRDNIVLSNIARNHSYPIAEAAAAAGYLRKFVTSVYWKPETAFGALALALASKAGDRERKRLEARRSPLLPDEKVVAIPLPEVVEEGIRQAGQRFGFDTRAATYLKCELFDWLVARRHLEPCAIFHGFEQCSLFSLRRAKELGAITVVDQPIIHRATLDRHERDERARWGVPAPRAKPFWFEEHLRRKVAEHALADYVFGGLDYVKTTMVESGYPAERVFVIPYGADTGTYRPIARPPRDTFEILYAGPLSFWKGLPYLLEAMQGLEVPGARLTIVGRPDRDWEGFFTPRIEALGAKVRYLGTVPQADMPHVYAGADVLVFPSLIGGLGLVCFEAMATAMPVITSDGDVILRDGVDGLVRPVRDVEGWRDALRRLARDRDFRLALGASAADRLKSFTWDAYRAGIVRAYEEIADREGRLVGADVRGYSDAKKKRGGATCPSRTA